MVFINILFSGITGGLTIDSWTDKVTFERRSRPKIVVKHLDILETKAEAEMRLQRQSNNYNNQYYGNNNGSWKGGSSSNDEDVEDDTMSAGTGGFFDD